MSSGKAAVEGDRERSEAVAEPSSNAEPSLEHIHVGVRSCLKLTRTKFGKLCYTCRPKPYTPLDQVPTVIAGIPVVIVPEPYEPIGASAWKGVPDPLTKYIDPGKRICKDDVWKIRHMWKEALGFYVLIDGNLQLIVPPGFNVLDAYEKRPRRFGGLNVSYIRESFVPFNWGEIPDTESLPERIEWPIKLRSHCTYKGKEATYHGTVSLANVSLRESPSTKCDWHLLVPTPMVVETLRHVKVPVYTYQSGPNMPVDQFSTKDVSLSLPLKNQDPSSAEAQPFQVALTFDSEIGSYPLGYCQGVNRVNLEINLGRRVRKEDLLPPIHTEIGRVSDYYDAKLDLLQDYTLSGSRRKKMAEDGLAPSEGQCQLVGQGLFLSQPGKPSEVSRWYLFRLHPASYDYPNCDLGSTLCEVRKGKNGEPMAEAVGFTGFSQAFNTMDYVPEFNKRRPDPSSKSNRRIAFFGAFESWPMLWSPSQIIPTPPFVPR